MIAVTFCLLAMTCAHAKQTQAIPSSGGAYFAHRVELPVPAFAQDAPKWTNVHLGPTTDTLGEEGCTLTSIVMVLNYYGIKTDPPRLNRYLTTHDGYDDEGYLAFDRIEPYSAGRIHLAESEVPSYRVLDENLLAGHPVIVQVTLPDGAMHFVVIAGKVGRDYLARDPAGDPRGPLSPLREISPAINWQYLFLKHN
jgi:hypothetical protein